jgi:hypothetical protein
MSKLKKLSAQKLAPVRRSSVAMAHSLRGGAGAGLHRDKSKYTRKAKHKRRLNPGPPAGMPEAKWLSSINTMKEDIRANLGAAVRVAQQKHKIFTKTRPNGETYEDSSAWPMAQSALGLIMASSPHAALAEEALLFEDSGEVSDAGKIVKSIMAPVFGDALKDSEVKDLYDTGVVALTEKIDLLRKPAIEAINSGEAALDEEEAEEDDEERKARLIALAKQRGDAELAEGIKRGLIELDDAEEILGGGDEVVEEEEEEEEEVVEEPKRGARAPRTPRTEAQQRRGQERAEQSAESLRVGKEKQQKPAEPTHQRGVPLDLERYVVARRDLAAGPTEAILNQARQDVLLWALDNGDTQVWAKGSCIVTFQSKGSGKSSPQIAAQFAAGWRQGKKSRYSARIFVGVQGHNDIVMKAPSLDEAARRAAAPGNPEQVAESIKMNPRYRRNAKMERVWGSVRFNPFDFKAFGQKASEFGQKAGLAARKAAHHTAILTTRAQIASERSKYRSAFNTLGNTYEDEVKALGRGDRKRADEIRGLLFDVMEGGEKWVPSPSPSVSSLKAEGKGIFGMEKRLRELEATRIENPRMSAPSIAIRLGKPHKVSLPTIQARLGKPHKVSLALPAPTKRKKK